MGVKHYGIPVTAVNELRNRARGTCYSRVERSPQSSRSFPRKKQQSRFLAALLPWRPQRQSGRPIYRQALESTTQGINEAWLYQSGKSWDAVLFFETDENVEKAEAQRGELEQRLGRDLEDEKIRLDFRNGNPERARMWMM